MIETTAIGTMRERCKSLGAEAVFDKSTEIQELMSGWPAAVGIEDRYATSRHFELTRLP